VTAASRARALVGVKTIGVAGVYLLTIWDVHVRIASAYISSPSLSLATAFVLVQSSAIGLLMTVLLSRKWMSEIQEQRARRLRPPILDALVAHATGVDRSAELSRCYRDHPVDVEQCLSDILSTITGASRDRLSQLAAELGVVARWRRQGRSRRVTTRRTAIAYLGQLSGGAGVPALLSALHDPEPEIQLDAARHAVRSGRRRTDIETVFAFAVRASLLTRAILADELRAHALVLCERALPESLRFGDRDQILIVLEMIEAWGRALPLKDVTPLVRHADREVRARALRVLTFVERAQNLQAEIVEQLRDEDPRVRGAAAFAAGRLAIESADVPLASCLRDPHPEVALAAGFALAELGPAGVAVLEREISACNRPAALVALEALERLKIGRCDYARR
jgi:hypothetical protein